MSTVNPRGERRSFGLLVAIIAVLLAVFVLSAAGVQAGPAWSFEIGKEVSPESAMYGLARVNLPLGEIPALGTQFWLLPEVGVVLTNPVKSYSRVQVMTDTPIGTVGVDVRVREWARVFVRFDL